MKISEIKTIIPTATEKFRKIFPDVSIPQIVVCSSSRRKAVREKVLAECGVAYKEYIEHTDAEVISGSLGTQIILYQSKMKTEGQLFHAVWHELGHIKFGTEEKYGIDLAGDTPKRSGYAIVNEFMAEFIAYTVNDFETFNCSLKAHLYLQMAFMEDAVNPYWLSRYFAIIAGDKNVLDAEIDDCEQYVTSDIWSIISKMTDEIFEQIRINEFWDVSDEFLEKIGCMFDEVFHLHYTNSAASLAERLFGNYK